MPHREIQSFNMLLRNFDAKYGVQKHSAQLAAGKYNLLIAPIQDFMHICEKFLELAPAQKPKINSSTIFRNRMEAMAGLCGELVEKTGYLDSHLQEDKRFFSRLAADEQTCYAKSLHIVEMAAVIESYYSESRESFAEKYAKYTQAMAERAESSDRVSNLIGH